MSNLTGHLLRGLTFLLPLIAMPSVAQEAGSREGAESNSGILEELLVTARRREENAQDVPIPVTALSGQDLKDRAADEVRDLTRITPSMDFQQSPSAKNTAQVFLRGSWGFTTKSRTPATPPRPMSRARTIQRPKTMWTP